MRTRLLALPLATALVLVAGCGAGGFDNSAGDRSTGPKTFQNYVALGDGFASGPYLGRDVSKTDCLRSADNYPAQVAQALKVATVTDVTCVGATTKALTSASSAPGSSKKLAPQLDAVTKDTDLVTLGIGIEDNDLLQGMFRVCLAEPCGSGEVLAPPLTKQLNAFGAAIATSVSTIQGVAPKATIVVVGYPQLMPVEGLCDALPPISAKQLEIAYGILNQLNRFLRSAAFQSGAIFVDVTDFTDDKTVCSKEPWMNGYKDKPGKALAFHPVAAEQAAVAEAISRQVRLFS